MDKFKQDIIHNTICAEYNDIRQKWGMSMDDAVRFLQAYGDSNKDTKYSRVHIRNILAKNSLYTIKHKNQ